MTYNIYKVESTSHATELNIDLLRYAAIFQEPQKVDSHQNSTIPHKSQL